MRIQVLISWTVLLGLLLQVLLAANGRPVVVLNPRMPYTPFEMEAFETVYQLRQHNVQPAKVNPKAKVREKSRQRSSRGTDCYFLALW